MAVTKHEPRDENWQTEYGHEMSANKVLIDLAVSVARLEEKVDGLIADFKAINERLDKHQSMYDEHQTLFTEIATEKRIAGILSKPLVIMCIFILLAEGGYRLPEIVKMFISH